jgi:hypothetical protein
VPDLAVADAAGPIDVLPGDGHGNFGTPIATQALNVPAALLATDLDGDGKLDLVYVDVAANAVAVLIGRGNGTFKVGEHYLVSQSPKWIVGGDFDHDGKLDLLVSSYDGSLVTPLAGHGDGTFTPQPPVEAGQNPHGLAVADLDGDGKLDAAVSSPGTSSLGILFGNGDLTFRAATALHPDLRGGTLAGVGVADFDGDGRTDLGVIGTGGLWVLPGAATGGFTVPMRPTLTFANGGPALADDLDGDGRPDLVVLDANPVDGKVTVLLDAAGATFTATSVPAGTTPVSMALGDLNGDGHPEIALADAAQGAVVLWNHGGTFGRVGAYPAGPLPGAVAIGDFDHDGKPDVAVADAMLPTVSVLRGVGDDTLLAAMSSPDGMAGALAMLAADLDGDGRLDVAIAGSPPQDNQVAVLLGKGDGSFGSPSIYESCNTPVQIHAADLDGDGDLDLVVTCRDNGQLVWMQNDGAAGFATWGQIFVESTPIAAAVLDWNGDARPDVVALDAAVGNLSLVANSSQ